ncbi:MAG: hypothetical protein HY328_13965 [Chloroflexi bacterium]|nr:hypothetical protein [Chloroflexota bacterium]
MRVSNLSFRRGFFLVAVTALVFLLYAPAAVVHAEEGAVQGGSCYIYYNTESGRNHAFCGSSLYPCQTKAYAAQRAASCPAVAPTPGTPSAPQPVTTPPIIVLPPTPPDPNMPAPDWLELIFPGFNFLIVPDLYNAPFAPFYGNVIFRADSFSANFVDPALIVPSEAIELDPTRNFLVRP